MGFFTKKDKGTSHNEPEFRFTSYSEEILNQKLGLPYKDLLSAAYAYVGKGISSFFESKGYTFPELRWLQTSLVYPAFQHMAFGFHDNVYSILIAFVKNGEVMIMERDRRNQLNECRENNLIPCLFPVLTDSFVPVFPGCHLISSESYETIELSPGKKNTPMSAWELSNFAVSVVMDDIQKEGGRIDNMCDLPAIEPNLWFIDKNGVRSYATVKAICGNTKENVSYKPNAQMMNKMKAFKGYYAEVFFASAEPVSYDANGNIVPPL